MKTSAAGTLLAFVMFSSAAMCQAPTRISLSWDGKDIRVGRSSLFAETFAFDPQQNKVDVPGGIELTIEGYPVPVRMTSISGSSFTGSMTAVYQNVIFDLGALPKGNRNLVFAVVAVRRDFKYDVELLAGDETSLFVDAANTVYPGAIRDIPAGWPLGRFLESIGIKSALGGPFATLAFKVEKATSPAAGVSISVKTKSGGAFTGTTNSRGEATILVNGLTDRICTLSGAGIDPSPLPLPLAGAREGLVQYDLELTAK